MGKVIQVTWMDEQKAQLASMKPFRNFSASRKVLYILCKYEKKNIIEFLKIDACNVFSTSDQV